jgi:limonene-1,2-epoxide hydrolase
MGGDNVGIVRLLWAAVREQDVEAVVGLTASHVDWESTAIHVGHLHGQEELRTYLAHLRAAGTLADAHPFSFEAVGESVIVSGVLNLRRHGDMVEGLQRWWVYGVEGGRVISASSHASRSDALRAARATRAAR